MSVEDLFDGGTGGKGVCGIDLEGNVAADAAVRGCTGLACDLGVFRRGDATGCGAVVLSGGSSEKFGFLVGP